LLEALDVLLILFRPGRNEKVTRQGNQLYITAAARRFGWIKRGLRCVRMMQTKQNIFIGGWSMNLKPLNDRVLVKRLESEEKTAGGLFIPDTAKEKPSKGEVIAVGPGKTADDGKLIAMTVKSGDVVLFNKYAGTEIKLDGVDHLVMREDDILAVIK
jgi:chaperonin GroES